MTGAEGEVRWGERRAGDGDRVGWSDDDDRSS